MSTAEVVQILALTALAGLIILAVVFAWYRYNWAGRNALAPHSPKEIMDNIRLLRRLSADRPRTGGRHRH